MTYYVPVLKGTITALRTAKTLTEARSMAIETLDQTRMAGIALSDIIIYGPGAKSLGLVARTGDRYFWQPNGIPASPSEPLFRNGKIKGRS